MNRSRWLPIAGLGPALLMVTLDMTIVAVALPIIGRDLQASPQQAQWVMLAYSPRSRWRFPRDAGSTTPGPGRRSRSRSSGSGRRALAAAAWIDQRALPSRFARRRTAPTPRQPSAA